MITTTTVATVATYITEILDAWGVAYTTTSQPDTIATSTGSIELTERDGTVYADGMGDQREADDIREALRLAPTAPAAMTIQAAVDAATQYGRRRHVEIAYYAGITEVTDGLTSIEVDASGDWTLYDTPIDGVDAREYRARDLCGAFEAGSLAYDQPEDARFTLIEAGDYEHATWDDIIAELDEVQVVTGDAGSHVYSRRTDGPGVVVTEGRGVWEILILEHMSTRAAWTHCEAAAIILHALS